MSIAEKLTQIAENEQRVYEAGINKLWNAITDNGKRDSYNYAFSNSGFEYIRPNRKITPIAVLSGGSTFQLAKNLKKVESAYFDFSQKVKGTSTSNGFSYTFYGCSSLEEIEDIGMQADYAYNYTFASCKILHTIAKIRADANTLFVKAFDACESLEKITVEGTIGQNGFNVKWSTKLNKASITSIINALSSTTSGLSITLSKTAVNNAFGINVDDETTYPEGSEYYILRHSKDNWTINYI